MRQNVSRDKDSKSRSRDKINESEIERRLKNCKAINDHQYTLENSSRNEKNEFSEVYITNTKTHRKFESYHNINSLIPKKKENQNDSRNILYMNNNSLHSNNKLTHNTSNNNTINTSEINGQNNKLLKVPHSNSTVGFIPKNNSSKKPNKRENSKDYKDYSGDNTPNKNNISKNIQNNSNIILNQQGVPCYNNINIYTSGLGGIKTNANDCNLRNYIFNKVGHHKKSNSSIRLNSGQHNKSSNHSRTNSTVGK